MTGVAPSALPPPAQAGLGPGLHLFSVVPSDTAAFAQPPRMLWVGGAGNIAVVALGDAAPITIFDVPAGTLIDWVVAQKVLVTGTTATNIVGIY